MVISLSRGLAGSSLTLRFYDLLVISFDYRKNVALNGLYQPVKVGKDTLSPQVPVDFNLKVLPIKVVLKLVH